MCLGIPAKIVALDEHKQGEVDYLGTRVKASFLLLEDPHLGDWVIIHAGYAISRLDESEAQETLALLREIAEAEGR
jgi:hydrogenase expression/formation protein HypC